MPTPGRARTVGRLWVEVVVDDQVNRQLLGNLAIDDAQELHKLLMTVSTSRAANKVVVPCRL
jgi:hypothetical protein